MSPAYPSVSIWGVHTFPRCLVMGGSKGVCRILVREVNAPLPPEAKKSLKLDYEMVHSEL